MAGSFTLASMGTFTSDPVLPSDGGPFAANYAVLNAPDVNEHQRRIISIVSAIQISKNRGENHDYTSAANQKQLVADARALTKGISNFDMEAALTVLLFEFGVTAGTVSSDVNSILNTGQYFDGLPNEILDRIVTLLLYRSFH